MLILFEVCCIEDKMMVMMTDKFLVLICLCPFINTQPPDFKTEQWILPGTSLGTPPIKFVTAGTSVTISCEMYDPNANTELYISPRMMDPFESAIKYSKGRMKQTGQMFKIERVTPQDYGRYKCVSEARGEKVELIKGLMMVKVPMKRKFFPRIVPGGGMLHVDKESNFEIKCKDPRTREKNGRSYLSWYKRNDNNDIVPVDPSKVKRRTSSIGGRSSEIVTLIFKSFKAHDIGEYTCRRKGSDGRVTNAKIKITMIGHCYFNGELQKVGVNFVSMSCTASCKCTDANTIQCVSLCPPRFVSCRPGEIEVTTPEEVSTSPKCFCKRKQCVKNADHCYQDEKLYTKNQRFISKSCKSCQCMGSNAIVCASLCTPRGTRCGVDEMEHYIVESVNTSPQCYCKKQTCVKITDVCKMKPESGPCYALFIRWHYNPASQSCEQFDYGGCEGNPNRFLYQKKCNDMCQTRKVIPRVGGGPVGSLGHGASCRFEGKSYKQGELFISKNCKKKCRCGRRYKPVTCEDICTPPVPLKCPKGSMAVSYPKVGIKSPKTCYCIEEKCVSTNKVCKMKAEAGSCYAHIRRWYYNPSLQSCEEFIYGGCEGNPNNFLSKNICNEMCVKNKIKPRTDGTKMFSVRGKIMFSSGDSKLPTPSCASVILISKTSKTYRGSSSTSFAVSLMDISQGIEYQLTSSSKDSSKQYTISAVVNVGWCKDQYTFHWVKEGDYITRVAHDVILQDGRESYEVDINVSRLPF